MTTPPIVRFRALIDGMPQPERAGRDALGTLPVRAARWCEAITSATSYGWWLYPPTDFELLFDGERVWWSCTTAFEGWLPLEAAQFPDFAQAFDAAAPNEARGYSPPFLTTLPEPGLVQVWTGLLAQTAQDWSLLLRAPVNMPNHAGAVSFEGIVETDLWSGPLFVNFRLTRSGEPILFRRNMPFVQAVPLHRSAYSDHILHDVEITTGLASLDDADWQEWQRDVVNPNQEPDPKPGHYAALVRRRRKSDSAGDCCPFHAAQLPKVNLPRPI